MEGQPHPSPDRVIVSRVIARTNALDKAELQMMQKMVEAKNDEIKKLESQMQDGLLERKTLADELNKAQNDIKSNKSDLEALKKGDPGQVIKRLEEEKKTLRYSLGIFICIPAYNLTHYHTDCATASSNTLWTAWNPKRSNPSRPSSEPPTTTPHGFRKS